MLPVRHPSARQVFSHDITFQNDAEGLTKTGRQKLAENFSSSSIFRPSWGRWVCVTLVAPTAPRPDVARAYAISTLGWIREQQRKLRAQASETPRRFIERESHSVWGRRFLLTIQYREARPSVSLDHKRIALTVRPGPAGIRRRPRIGPPAGTHPQRKVHHQAGEALSVVA